MSKLWEEYLIQEDLIGHSPAIYQIRRSIPILAKGDQPVLIIGEPGTEKLLIAKLIIDNSVRKKAPVFITDAAKLNKTFDQEIQSLLQQQEHSSADGLRGTLIVQNLEYLDRESQARLMSFAQGGYLQIQPHAEPIAAEFRIISTATSKLQEYAKEGIFSSELYLTLSAMTVKLPALRERRQDIVAFFEFYLNYFCRKIGRSVPPMPFEIFHQILKYSWPGNVKEMENAVRSVVVSSPEGMLLIEALPFVDEGDKFQRVELQSLNRAVAQLEKEMIERALRRFAGNQSRAAQVLHLSEPNLRFKMKKLGIRKEEFIMGNE